MTPNQLAALDDFARRVERELTPDVIAKHREWALQQFGRAKCIPGYITMDAQTPFTGQLSA